MNSIIKLIAIGTIASISLIGCSSQKDMPNNIEDKGTEIEISETSSDNQEDNTSEIDKDEEEQKDDESTEKEDNKVVASNNKENENKDNNKDTTTSKVTSQPAVQNSNATTSNKVTQNTSNTNSTNTAKPQEDKKEEKEELKQQQPSQTKVPEEVVYRGSAMGENGMINVKVTVVDGKISNIEVLSHEETPRLALRAFEELTNTIISTQTLDVDAISGASATSEGFIKAVKKALNK